MSTTIGGLTSTIGGNLSKLLKDITKVFQGDLSNILSGIISIFDSVSPKIIEFAGNARSAFQAFAQSEQAGQYLQIFKTIGETVFNAIGAVVQAVSPVIQSIFTFIGQHSQEISAIVQALGAIWDSVWKTVGTLLQGAWGICEPILSLLVKGLAKVSGVVQDICDWWNKMVGLLSKPINATVNVVKKGIGGVANFLGLGSEGRNAFGSGRIARDGTVRTLHEGEKVLTKRETDAYLRGQNNTGVNITVNGLTVREEADIDKIASAFVRKIKEAKLGYSGVMA